LTLELAKQENLHLGKKYIRHTTIFLDKVISKHLILEIFSANLIFKLIISLGLTAYRGF